MAEYFAHDYDARNDMKVVLMVSEHGAMGYAAFFISIEILHAEGGFLKKNALKVALSHYLRIKPAKSGVLIDRMIDVGLLQMFNDEQVSSKRVQVNLLHRKSKSEKSRAAGKASAAARSTDVQQTFNGRSTDGEPLKEKESKVKVKREERESVGAKAPSRDDVHTLFRIRGQSIEEADRFFDHYDAQGWVRGNGQVIHNWQALIPRWIEKQKEINNGNTKRNRGERVGYTRDTTAEYLSEIAGAIGGVQSPQAGPMAGATDRQALLGTDDTHPQRQDSILPP